MLILTGRKRAIARRFGSAACGYEGAAVVQRVSASTLARHILEAGLAPRPRILEIGCGTGLLTAALRARIHDAEWTITDLSADMLRRCRSRFGDDPSMRFAAMDAEAPTVPPGFDLVCGGLAMQWFEDRDLALSGLAGLLARGGLLALSTLGADSFLGWRAALGTGTADSMLAHPSLETLQQSWPAGGAGSWRSQTLLERHARGIDFLRGLRDIGADLPRPGAAPLDALALRRVLRRFEAEQGGIAEYQIAYGLFRRAPQAGVFVTGTDTGIGKTVVSACLARAWNARYWKPLQTGLAEEAGDTPTVARLAALSPEDVLPPLHALQAPLSPQAAAELEGVGIDPDRIVLPAPSTAPLVVEGAGGLFVPVAEGTLMIDLIARLALPVVLVARGTLGTVNHTLLSLEALRARGIAVAGVVFNQGCTASNREAVARHGRVRILAELPHLDRLDAAGITHLATLMPPFCSLAGPYPQ